MKVLTTEETYSGQDASWLYNGLDCCVTKEIFDELDDQLKASPENVQQTYQETLEKLPCFMEMSLRGIKVDTRRLTAERQKIFKQLMHLESNFRFLTKEIFDDEINAGSWQQVAYLLYIYLGLPGKGTDRERLMYLRRNFFARPFIDHILKIRDLRKQLGYLRSTLTKDNRLTYNINPAGTNTGRSACRESAFRIGTNAQNIDRRHKRFFRADTGKVLVEVDLEQADSRNVGAICYKLFGKDNYLKACEESDLHSTVAKMVFQISQDQVRTEYKYGKTYRDFAKNVGHGTNYMGSAIGISKITGVPSNAVKSFQDMYFRAFPEIQEWHKWTASELPCITTIFGRRRYFHDRPWDPGTVREAVAYQGQSATAHEIDRAIVLIRQSYEWVQLLVQVHDSILFQIPIDKLNRLGDILETMKVKLNVRDRTFYVPLEAQYGKYWDKKEMATWDG